MQVQIEDLSPVEKKLDVEVPWEEVRQRLDKAYQQLGRGVSLRGFRKGKVPRSVLERMFARQVHGEVAQELVQESFLRAAHEHALVPVSEPIVDEASIKKVEPFRYTARVEVRAKTELKEYEGFELTRRPLKIDEHEVEHALSRKQRENTEFRTIEGRDKTARTDVVRVALRGSVGELPVDKPDVIVDLGDVEHEPLPGLAAALVGIALDAKDHAVKIEIPEDWRQKEIAGKTADLMVTVVEAREKIVPELDDEFAKDLGLDSLAELQEQVRKELEKQAEEEIDRETRQQALKELVKRNPVPLAPALIERGVDHQLERARFSLAMQGIDMNQAGIDMNEMRERFRESAAEEIRGQLLLEELAEKENIEISEDEVDARVAELARSQQKPAAKLKAEMDHDGSLESLRWRLRQEKALDLVVARATITEKEPEGDGPESEEKKPKKGAASKKGGKAKPKSGASAEK